MKKSTIIGMAVGGLLVIGGGILAYFKREEIKDISKQVAEELQKRLKKNEPAVEDTAHQGQAEE